MSELWFKPATELAALLGAGRLSSVEMLQSLLARVKALDGRVHAFNSFDEGDALTQARAADDRHAAGRARPRLQFARRGRRAGPGPGGG